MLHAAATPKPTAAATSTQVESSETGVSRGEAMLMPAARKSHAKADGKSDRDASRAERDQRVKRRGCVEANGTQPPRKRRHRPQQAEPGETGVSRGKAVLAPAARSGNAKIDGDGDEHACQAKRGSGIDELASRAKTDQRVERQSCAVASCTQQPRQGRRRRWRARKPSRTGRRWR